MAPLVPVSRFAAGTKTAGHSIKRTGVSRTPLRKGEKLNEKIDMQLAAIKKMPGLVKAFFKTPSVTYITD
jgi:hypothetical protein